MRLGGCFAFWVRRLKDIPARRSLKKTHRSHHLHLLRRTGIRAEGLCRPASSRDRLRSSGRQARSRRPHPRLELRFLKVSGGFRCCSVAGGLAAFSALFPDKKERRENREQKAPRAKTVAAQKQQYVLNLPLCHPPPKPCLPSLRLFLIPARLFRSQSSSSGFQVLRLKERRTALGTRGPLFSKDRPLVGFVLGAQKDEAISDALHTFGEHLPSLPGSEG